jgi:hypothetical protein
VDDTLERQTEHSMHIMVVVQQGALLPLYAS